MAPASTKFLKLDDRISCDLHVSYSSNANSGRIEASDSEGSRRSPRGQASPPPGNDSDWAWHHQRPRRRGAAREKIEREKFVAGAVLPKGTCVVPRERRRGDIIIRGGKLIESKLNDVLPELTAGDVFIKGANALDASGAAGVLLASRRGGTVGSVLGTLMARGVNFIIPVGLEKFIPGSIQRVSKTTGIFRASYATGCPLGIMPVAGKVITELEAFEILTGAEAITMGKGGISGAEGSVTLLVQGTQKQLSKARKLVNGIKGEPSTKVETNCRTCKLPDCWYRAR